MPRRRPSASCTVRRLLRDLITFRPPGRDVPGASGGGKLIPAQTAGALSRATDQVAAARPRDTRGARRVVPMAGLALDAHGGQARHDDSVASPGLATLLAMDIPRWSATDSGRPAALDRHDGPREPDLGRGADRGRTPAEVGADRVASHGGTVSSGSTWARDGSCIGMSPSIRPRTGPSSSAAR